MIDIHALLSEKHVVLNKRGYFGGKRERNDKYKSLQEERKFSPNARVMNEKKNMRRNLSTI